MSLSLVLPVAFALSTDAFAVAIAKGTRVQTRSLSAAARVGALFGVFEAGMCILGWGLSSLFADAIRAFDHWIALLLLGGVGAKMILDALRPAHAEMGDVEQPRQTPRLLWLLTAMGTSIDAAAVGVAFALTSVSILFAAPIIGAVSFAASTLGFYIAPVLGERFGQRAELAGGFVLIIIGLMIFISHQFGGIT